MAAIASLTRGQYGLPSAPHCHTTGNDHDHPSRVHCDPHEPPPWGYLPAPPSPDPRTGLIWHDFLRHVGWRGLWWITGDIGRHPYKSDALYLKEWHERIEGHMWRPPKWLESLADDSYPSGS